MGLLSASKTEKGSKGHCSKDLLETIAKPKKRKKKSLVVTKGSENFIQKGNSIQSQLLMTEVPMKKSSLCKEQRRRIPVSLNLFLQLFTS